ncbi:MAG: dephospho-CoA kinase [Clostridia bacterium]|nr:dephospho-CoA kinase [Clostridia bacterium]
MEKKVIAVTGGIGSGKSTVCRLLEKKGFRVVDCDALSRRAAERSDTLEEIVRVFGERFVDGGKLNRRALALEVFSDSEKTDKLNKIFHKRIFGLLEEEIAKQNGTVFVEIQLLPDDKIRLFDGVWLVTASEETRIKRAMARDDRSEEQVRSIIQRQNAFCGKQRENVEILVNDGDAATLEKAVENLLKKVYA